MKNKPNCVYFHPLMLILICRELVLIVKIGDFHDYLIDY